MGKEITNEQKRQYNRNYYLEHREQRLNYQRAYNRDYRSNGLHKPRQRKPRSIRDHERYMEKRDEILENQRIYRELHRDEINARHRKRRSDEAVKRQRILYQQLNKRYGINRNSN